MPNLSASFVSVKTITKRELSRNPAKVSELKPGESMIISDRQGGLTLRREKKVTISPADMEAELNRICQGCPPVDSLAMMEEEQ
jgi:hypothetical protein